ncbi:hypothetical protein RRG08_027099 [Elysia crispata]|uniref:Uncharacterized protein n=1 Tax=Elysia crispata TaxID=231223 RepID=A0AAE0YSY8_9GAST|nr:hypothetical protein RRG08_027099 [Elysia crispata]
MRPDKESLESKLGMTSTATGELVSHLKSAVCDEEDAIDSGNKELHCHRMSCTSEDSLDCSLAGDMASKNMRPASISLQHAPRIDHEGQSGSTDRDIE